jgi:hypothetical protein
MALYHVHAAVIAKGTSVGGATGFARYMAREDPDNATQFVRYLDREGGREDLVAKGYGGMPAWAHSSRHFWQMADRYERGGAQRPGTVARTYEIALPRELSAEARLELAADIRATFFERYPHSWAIHNPIDAQGLEHPHMHLMLSERRVIDGIERGPKQYFAQAASPTQDPARHGVRKDRSWQGPARLHELREGVATLTNAALAREGHAVAVSHESLRTRGLAREAGVYRTAAEKDATLARREVLHRDYHPLENEVSRAAWYEQKAREGIRDLSREAMIDHVRDRFWVQDQSPEREQERAASLARTLDRAYERTGRERGQSPAGHQPPPRTPQRQQALAVVVGLDLDDMPHHGGLRVRLDEREREWSR